MFTRENGLSILLALFNSRYEELNYENVDEFYAYLGYDLEIYYELGLLGIESTSGLLEEFEKLED